MFFRNIFKIFIILLFFFAVILGYLFAVKTTTGIGIAGLMCSTAVVLACILDTQTGLYINLIYSFFAFAFSRFFFNDAFPTGVASDILIVATLFSFFVKRVGLKITFNKFIHTSVVIAILVLFFYLMIELFNPYGHSLDGWYQTFRKSLDAVFLLEACY